MSIWAVPFREIATGAKLPGGMVATVLQASVVGPFDDGDRHALIRELFALSPRPDAAWIGNQEVTPQAVQRAVERGHPIGSLPGMYMLVVWDDDDGRPVTKVQRPTVKVPR